MKKSVMISLSPYWYYLIGEGIKKIEIRKTFPKSEEWNHIIECYMTKDKKSFDRIPKEFQEKYSAHMGKVGMQVKCDHVFPIRVFDNGCVADYMFHNLDRSCVPYDEIATYIGYDKTGYGLDISIDEIYDNPKELSEFFTVPSDNDIRCKHVEMRYTTNGRRYNKCTLQNCVCEFRKLGHQTDCDGYEILNPSKPLTRPPQSWCYVENLQYYKIHSS